MQAPPQSDTLSEAPSGISYQCGAYGAYEGDAIAAAAAQQLAAQRAQYIQGPENLEGQLDNFYYPAGPAVAAPHVEHCAYCGVLNPESIIKCELCQKWFCNGSGSKHGGSHIVTHLVLSKHKSVRTHPSSPVGDTVLECYNCGSNNIFVLGFVSAMEQNTIVILCRLPCAHQKDHNWDTENWQPLIEDRKFLPWLVAQPSDEDRIHSNSIDITPEQISKLEAKWRIDKNATLSNIEEEDQVEVTPILMRYQDGFEYQRSFAPLVKIEADHDKALKESSGLEYLSVEWGLGLNNKHVVSFTLSSVDSTSMRVAIGDEMVLKYSGSELAYDWHALGHIIKLPNARSEYFTLEFDTAQTPPTHITTRFTGEFVWKGTSYDRMQQALQAFALDSNSLSEYLYCKLLGKTVEEVTLNIKRPTKLSVPGQPKLNESQSHAVDISLKSPLTLIQGPPGTGKTQTSGTIVYHLNKMYPKKKMLVCAPSNVAVDHLTSKLSQLGLNVVRLLARSRGDVESSVSDRSLDNLIQKRAPPHLKKLLALKEEKGELNKEQEKQLRRDYQRMKQSILKSADIVCATCVGAGDHILDGFDFHAVLIDESTQASEPESLIPITRGVKQVILVGDHQQLGPVILSKKAADAGLRQSLFERLIFIGHNPVRLEVQYRMHPCLSEFPSNMFYDGSLQNGITEEDRTVHDSNVQWPMPDTPMMFWSIYGREEISISGTSYLNRVEAMNVEKIVTKLFMDGVSPDQIGIITPYEGQRAYISEYMQLNATLSDKQQYMDIEILSIDAFQGREKDYIILSCVRANASELIGFLKDPRRLNVALTRAKYGLFILGNPKSLNKNKLWNHLLTFFREAGCLVEGQLENLQVSRVQLSRIPRQYENFAKVKDRRTNRGDTASVVSYNGRSNFTYPSLNQAYGREQDRDTIVSYSAYNGTFSGTNSRINGSEADNITNPPSVASGAVQNELSADLQKLTSTFTEFTF